MVFQVGRRNLHKRIPEGISLFLWSYKLILDVGLDWNLFIICLNQIKNVKETFKSEKRDNKNHSNYLSGYHLGQQSQSIIRACAPNTKVNRWMCHVPTINWIDWLFLANCQSFKTLQIECPCLRTESSSHCSHFDWLHLLGGNFSLFM